MTLQQILEVLHAEATELCSVPTGSAPDGFAYVWVSTDEGERVFLATEEVADRATAGLTTVAEHECTPTRSLPS